MRHRDRPPEVRLGAVDDGDDSWVSVSAAQVIQNICRYESAERHLET